MELLRDAFGAEEIERHAFSEDSAHVELAIADSVVVVETGPLPEGVRPWTCAVYVYVPDVDAAFAEAVEHGVEVVAEPADKPYGERQAGVRDAAGNTWWIGSLLG